MGAGKSSVGRLLAQRMKWIFEDLDDRIEQCEGRSVPEIFRSAGEEYFRSAERTAVQQLLAEMRSGGDERIVALGGGAFVQPAIAGMLQVTRVPTIFLDAPVEELWQRCQRQAGMHSAERPLVSSIDRFSELYRARRGGYMLATLRIETGGRSIQAVVDEIVQLLKRMQKGDIN